MSYKAEQISDTELNDILDAAIAAPKAVSVPKWHFTVVQDKDMLDRMVEDIIGIVRNSGNKFLIDAVSRPNHHTFYHAPTVIIVSGDKSSPETIRLLCSSRIYFNSGTIAKYWFMLDRYISPAFCFRKRSKI